ncbi:SDR family NAD(P)-dependent oxidoreductase [Rhodococcus opacus]|uniref:SDR family NAD(P)-dependent oxidoreductase n=1 Tax=Rhodococcus opacus TaxID=37919 RepID=UPI001C48E0CA|nr:glucose 1-dehydrogenase [Rhodococcus opacus]MBV6756678.1 glucose 1-dehydrogenase [Rhodococcus opacus]
MTDLVGSSSDGSLKGKVAVVTGASRGLGRAIAEGFLAAGAKVVVAARSSESLAAFVETAKVAGGSALAVTCDVTDEAAVEQAAHAAIAEFGRIDILVNNSGVLATRALLDQDVAEWDQVMATNLRGVFLMTRAFGRHLVDQREGKVINIASNFGLKGIANHAAYASSKAGIIEFTRCMALEWAAHNVQVNAIAPGYFATDLNASMRADEAVTSKVMRAIPARRMGEPSELVPWVLLLAGSASNFMTGETIVIDGGQSVR